ncbi:MOSC domain-containing protein, partial [Serratia nevei]
MSIISKIIHYPLKSGSGISSGFCTGSMNGITGDRIYCLFDSENNKFITLRDTPLLTDILITEIDGRLSVSIEGKISEFDTPPPLDGVIKIWSREVDVTVFRGNISEFISTYLKINVILAKIKHINDFSHCFMDTGPIHIISQNSLEKLKKTCGLDEIDHAIFRPNIIVSEFPCPNEKDIKKVIINGNVFRVTEMTERCEAISILHRKLLSVSDSQILETLDELNEFDGAIFGIYVRADSDFFISINDIIEIQT